MDAAMKGRKSQISNEKKAQVVGLAVQGKGRRAISKALGIWELASMKRGIAGVHHSVSAKHLQAYINEYAFRYNHRGDEQAMFRTVGERIREVKAGRYGQYAPVG